MYIYMHFMQINIITCLVTCWCYLFILTWSHMPFTSVLIENACVVMSLYISALKTAFMRSSRSEFFICHLSYKSHVDSGTWGATWLVEGDFRNFNDVNSCFLFCVIDKFISKSVNATWQKKLNKSTDMTAIPITWKWVLDMLYSCTYIQDLNLDQSKVLIWHGHLLDIYVVGCFLSWLSNYG